MDKENQIGHLLDNQDAEGCPVSIQWDKKDGEDLINIKDAEGKIIIQFQKKLWEHFTPNLRDSIIQQTIRLYG